MTDIVQKLWGFCHTLRHDGIDYGDYIEQITYLLFLKMADERGIAIPKDCDWPTLRDWIAESRATETARRRIERDAADWHDRGDLYRSRRLADALDVTTHHRVQPLHAFILLPCPSPASWPSVMSSSADSRWTPTRTGWRNGCGCWATPSNG